MKNKVIFTIALLVIVVLVSIIILKGNNYENSILPKQSTTLTNQWKEYNFNEIRLKFSAPSDMQVNGNSTDNSTFTLTVQRGEYPSENYYQLYGLYNFVDTSTVDTEGLKSELNPESIVQTEVAGFKAIKGQYKGERNRLVTFIITKTGLFTLATSQPTSENEKLTDDILKTFVFK